MLIGIAISGALAIFFLLHSIMASGEAKRADLETRISEMRSREDAVRDASAHGKKPAGSSFFRSEKNRKRIMQFEEELYNVGIQMPASTVLTYWTGSMIILTLLLVVTGVNPFLAVLFIFALAFAPFFIIKSKKLKRTKIIEAQLVEAINVLCNALKAGHSFQQAMANISKEMDGPISEEFGRVFRETQRGMQLDDSLERMCMRIRSDDLTMMCTAIEIQRQIGGNLAQVLMNISGTIQARMDLKADIKVKSSSGRISGLVIGCMPAVLFLMFLVVNREYMSFFISTTLGYILIGVCIVLEVLGFIVINKIVDIRY
ncbi:MAG: type II secretion system F family protein [Oscillospiraceae bacterium]|nr:type II secretion system F family protein [Oscillospiraceae bacterium]